MYVLDVGTHFEVYLTFLCLFFPGGVILAVESIWADFKAAAERQECSAAQDDDSAPSSAKAMSTGNSQTCLITVEV